MIDGEFALCNLADDLLLLTLDMCDRDGKNPRTPKRIHRSLADRIVLTASAIEEATILANETPPSQQRAAYQQEAMRRSRRTASMCCGCRTAKSARKSGKSG